MKVKRALTVLLCVIMCALLFTACQTPEDAATVAPTPTPSETATTDELQIAMKPGDVYRAFV